MFDSAKESPVDPEDFFDDCPVCQAQKRAISEGRELTMEELVAAMGEASKFGGVSGSMMP
jgi:Zn finger protein HypA/HybF involved in hydrogenase expression